LKNALLQAKAFTDNEKEEVILKFLNSFI